MIPLPNPITTMSTIAPQAASPSLSDGYHGAADAAELACYDHDLEIECVHVQSTGTSRNHSLLRRAGVKRQRRLQFYAVKVIIDACGRLQLAPAQP